MMYIAKEIIEIKRESPSFTAYAANPKTIAEMPRIRFPLRIIEKTKAAKPSTVKINLQ